MHENEILTLISPKISHQILQLLQDGYFGICGGKTKITDLNTSCTTLTAQNPGNCDRFKVVIPFAGQTITWEVLFDCNYPESPPDFIFGSEDLDFFPDIYSLKSLVEWDYKDPSCLGRVIEELLYQYRKYQENIINGTHRLKFEYSSLVEDTDIKSEDVEIHVSRTENRMGPINFLMKLHVDFGRIPAYIVKLDPGEDAALLLVSFNSPEGTRITPQLYLSPRVERALGGSANLRIPGFPVGSCLSEYVPDVTLLLKNKVDQVVKNYEKRKEYIAAFLSMFGRSVLEYDAEGFTKISFLFEWHDFFFIISIELPAYFPKDQPYLTFQSVYHENKGKPYFETHQDDYPYSPRWSGLEMADRTRTFILDNIGAFQRQSVNVCVT
ncbi:BRISC and BRCA1-A complex member 2-like [Mercenaria mercenaria]|uniref:BRISC and BRCA1-A complex member 2-like n=1 Tax=Mercenaria mercenaria TaxID=6596 RepID=UPI001E1DAAA3|nr:BRISC and BRCA1-A complex member 2-like [Mercenaria mercenaria]